MKDDRRGSRRQTPGALRECAGRFFERQQFDSDASFVVDRSDNGSTHRVTPSPRPPDRIEPEVGTN